MERFVILASRPTFILPFKGRWLANGQTEGCRPIAVPLPFQGRMA